MVVPSGASDDRPMSSVVGMGDGLPITVAVTSDGGETTVTVGGELDMATTPTLADVLRERIAEGPSRLILDLADVTFMGSSGLAVLVAAHDQAAEHNVDVVLTRLPEVVRRPLVTTALDTRFDIRDSA